MSVNTKVNGELVRSAGLYKVNTPMSVAEYYSTEEHKIGVWTNGKPIYQISITGLSLALTANAWTTLTGVTIPNGEDLVGVECYGEYTEQYVINCTKVHLNKADGNIEVRCTESSTTLTGITLQYTKTTDSEKGGVYAPIIPMQIASKYSIDEKVVGEWIDHKPLYQKSIHLTDVLFPNNSRTIVPWTGYISDIDVIAYAEAVTVDELNRNLNAYQISSFSSYGLAFYADKTDGMIFSRGNGGNYTTDVVVTVRYTKTTDTAGTGLYSDDEATLGMLGDVDLENLADGDIIRYNGTSKKFENVPKEEYSTDEQVIGKWIDGSTIYRKVLNLSPALACNSSVWTYIENSSFGTGILPHYTNAIAIDPNGTVFSCIGVNYNDSRVGVLNTRNASINVKTLIIEYTKASS